MDSNADIKSRIEETVRKICGFDNRLAGSEGENKTADWVRDRFTDLGLSVSEEDFETPRTYPSIVMVHLLVGLAGILLARVWSLLGVAVVGFGAVSAFGEMTCRFFWLRRVLPTGHSRNVLGVKSTDNAQKKIIFMAHTDAAPEIENLRNLRIYLLPSSKIPFVFLSALTAVYIIRFFGGSGLILGLAELLLFLAVLVLAILAVQWHFSNVASPGANDGASGIAVLLEAARHFAANPQEGIEYWFMAAGASETNFGGTRYMLGNNFYRFDHYSTYFIDLPALGGGSLYYATAMRRLMPVYYPPDLVYLAGHTIREENFDDVSPAQLQIFTDGVIPARNSYNTATIVALDQSGLPAEKWLADDLPESVDSDTCANAFKFVVALAGRIAKE